MVEFLVAAPFGKRGGATGRRSNNPSRGKKGPHKTLNRQKKRLQRSGAVRRSAGGSGKLKWTLGKGRTSAKRIEGNEEKHFGKHRKTGG